MESEIRYSCPIVDGEEISDAECVDICFVAEKMIKQHILDSRILKKENFREICKECPHHNMD